MQDKFSNYFKICRKNIFYAIVHVIKKLVKNTK